MGRKKLDCETRKKGKLCGKEECKPCFVRSFASHEKSKYLVEGQGNPLLMARSSAKKYSFICPKCSHRFETTLHDVSSGYFCPFCCNNKLCPDECETCFEKSLASRDVAKFWDFEKNDRVPRNVFAGSHKKYWFKCNKCSHSFEASPESVMKGGFCPFCSNRKLCALEDCGFCHKNSFASNKNSEFWDHEKNKKNPREVFRSCGKKFWFNCGVCKHSFDASPNNIVGGKFCPFCGGVRLCSEEDCEMCHKNSFASSERSACWILEKNKQTPREVFAFAHKKYWFSCRRGHEFCSILSSISNGSWCPLCKNKTEAKLFSFLEENFQDPIHQFKASWCKSPETNKFLPFDFCVSKTIIEVDGIQHYKQVSNWKSPEVQQKSDRYKEEQATRNGYSVLRILQEDVWEDKIDWKKLLLEHVKDYESPITKNLWDKLPDSAK